MKISIRLFLLVIFVGSLAGGQKAAQDSLAGHIRGELEFLASDALQGRGSGTHDELITAVYLGSELRQMGIEPGGDNGGYVQDASGDYKFRDGPKHWATRNVIGILRGHSPTPKNEVLMLSAHMYHLGVGRPVDGDVRVRRMDWQCDADDCRSHGAVEAGQQRDNRDEQYVCDSSWRAGGIQLGERGIAAVRGNSVRRSGDGAGREWKYGHWI